MNTAQLPIEETYGYLIFRTEEEKRAAEPKRKTDEFKCLCENCVSRVWSGVLENSVFDEGDMRAYRRRIDPGEGCRIVGLDELLKIGDEVYCAVRREWTESFWHKSGNVTVEMAVKTGKTIGAFRRKIEPATEPKQEPKGWVLCSERLPKSDGRMCLVQTKEGRVDYAGGSYITLGRYFRWLDYDDPKPIKSPDDAAFEEWEKRDGHPGSSLHSECAKAAWNAALAYARKGGVK